MICASSRSQREMMMNGIGRLPSNFIFSFHISTKKLLPFSLEMEIIAEVKQIENTISLLLRSHKPNSVV